VKSGHEQGNHGVRLTKLIFRLGLLALASGTAWAADQRTLQQQYEHVQGLNNEASEVLHLPHPEQVGPSDLAHAEVLARQGLMELDHMQPQVDDADYLNGQMENRRLDLSLKLAEANALQGKNQAALDALDSLRNGAFYASYDAFFEKIPALLKLRNEPRYRALVANLHTLDQRWKATAIVTPSPADLDEAHRIAGLSLFWSEARYNFAYFDHVPDLDWNQAYLDFLPRVIAAESLHDYYDVLMRFAPLLRDGHTNIYPPEALSDEFYAKPAVGTSLVEGRVLITDLNSARVKASGLKIGDEIDAIDGVEVHQYAKERVEPYVSSSTQQDRFVRMYNYQLLRGDHRQPVVLTVDDAPGRQRRVMLSREADPQAIRSPNVEWRMLDGGIAYLAVNELEDGAGAEAFAKHLPEILKARGLILDVRRNGGGSTNYGLDILSYLSDRPIPQGQAHSLDYVPTYRARGGPNTRWKRLGDGRDGYSNPRVAHYAGPVEVLIGPETFSAGEDFVLSFDAMKRGQLIGEPSGGSTGQPLQFALPGGGSARVCTLRYSYPDGREFVGKGIAPDIAVAPTVMAIRAGRDLVLERAVTTLRRSPSIAPQSRGARSNRHSHGMRPSDD
jgi:C-terminal processing protease CtpA/Prc